MKYVVIVAFVGSLLGCTSGNPGTDPSLLTGKIWMSVDYDSLLVDSGMGTDSVSGISSPQFLSFEKDRYSFSTTSTSAGLEGGWTWNDKVNNFSAHSNWRFISLDSNLLVIEELQPVNNRGKAVNALCRRYYHPVSARQISDEEVHQIGVWLRNSLWTVKLSDGSYELYSFDSLMSSPVSGYGIMNRIASKSGYVRVINWEITQRQGIGILRVNYFDKYRPAQLLQSKDFVVDIKDSISFTAYNYGARQVEHWQFARMPFNYRKQRALWDLHQLAGTYTSNESTLWLNEYNYVKDNQPMKFYELSLDTLLMISQDEEIFTIDWATHDLQDTHRGLLYHKSSKQ